jgi:hypothetical protein
MRLDNYMKKMSAFIFHYGTYFTDFPLDFLFLFHLFCAVVSPPDIIMLNSSDYFKAPVCKLMPCVQGVGLLMEDIIGTHNRALLVLGLGWLVTDPLFILFLVLFQVYIFHTLVEELVS